MSKATDAILEALHGAFAEDLKARLEARDDDGRPTASASELNVIRQFLKDNGIDSVPTEGSPVSGLAEKMKQIGADEMEEEGPYH